MSTTPNYGAGILAAGNLNTSHIGTLFRWMKVNVERGITVVTTAPVRQISHDSGMTVVTYGVLNGEEETFAHAEPLMRYVERDHRDLARLLDAHQTWKDTNK